MTKSEVDKFMWVLVTAVTNFACCAPLIVVLRKNFLFEVFIGTMTIFTSFMYHLCDSIDGSLWLDELRWHRLDNVFAIQSFVMLFIYLCGLPDLKTHLLVNFFSFGCVILLQEYSPWEIEYTLFPVLSAILGFTAWMLYRHFNYDPKSKNYLLRYYPRYNYNNLLKGLAIMIFAIMFFIRGLDDRNDPYRFCMFVLHFFSHLVHGLWHCTIAFSSYFMWQVVPGPIGCPGCYVTSNGFDNFDDNDAFNKI